MNKEVNSQNLVTFNMKLNNNAIPLDTQGRVVIVFTNHQSNLPMDLEICVALEVIQLNEP